MESEFYSDSAYTADISKQMRVPDRLMAHNGNVSPPGNSAEDQHWNHSTSSSLYNMQVPDRILVAGSDQHIPSKSTPRELQLENSVIPPTPEHVRVHTPPRNITLDLVSFPTVQDEPFCPTPIGYRRSIKLGDVPFPSAGDTPVQESPPKSNYFNNFNSKQVKKDRTISFDPDLSLTQGSEASLSLYDEVQRVRTQMAKLNHRLMALELENQQHNQRWQVVSVLVSAYFLVKTMAWINRN